MVKYIQPTTGGDVKLWLPLDTKVKSNDFSIPSIENQRMDIFSMYSSVVPNEDEVEEMNEDEMDEDEREEMEYEREEMDEDEKGEETEENEWIDVHSFSFNISHGGKRRPTKIINLKRKYESMNDSDDEEVEDEIDDDTFGDEELYGLHFKFSKNECDRSPTFKYLSLTGITIPYAIIRKTFNSKVIKIIEYEMRDINIVNVSNTSNGSRGVEDLEISAKFISFKSASINKENGEFETYQVSNWDIDKRSGSKTIYTNNSIVSNKLAKFVKKRSMIDFDSRDSQDLSILKQLGINTDQEDRIPFDSLEIYKVLIKKEPRLFATLDINENASTLETIKKEISKQIKIPSYDIKNLYNYDNGTLLTGSNKKALNLTTTFLVETIDGKFYGY